jgi:membrane protease YdiL (CAAX protease family)
VLLSAWLRRHRLSTYFFLAYAVSWSIAVPLALQAQGLLTTNLPWALHYLTAFGPAASALICAMLLREPMGAARSIARGRSAVWWAAGFGSPLALFAVAQLAARAVGQPAPAWADLGRVNFLPDLGVAAWALWLLTSGIGEELGWRGFALPRLQRTHSALTSSVLLSMAWAGWHLPAFFYLPSYAAIGLRILPGFFVGILAGSIVLTWLYNGSGGSVFAAVLWHASFNFVTGSPSAAGLAAAVTSTLVIVWAVAIVWRYDWATLANRATRPGAVGTVQR